MTTFKYIPRTGKCNPRFNKEEGTLHPHPQDTRQSDDAKMRSYIPGRKMTDRMATLRATKFNDPICGYQLSATAMIGSRKGARY
jgi:hypothetical protein